ncbi:MAG TPA: HAMP domain-containing sensor histidine kinase [Marinagarivorans sp.]
MNIHDNNPAATDKQLILHRLFALRVLLLVSLFSYAFIFNEQPASLQTAGVLFTLSALLSSYIGWRYRKGRRVLKSNVLVAQLVWDALVILIFVYTHGGSTNPFIYYLLVIIAISASVFREPTVWMFCASGICAYSALMYLDTNAHLDHMTSAFKSHLIGMWINFVGSAVLISFFISRLTATLKSRERALALAREEILKNEQLIGIGTLAASTVHSFGTPLSTITLATHEIAALHQDADTANYTNIIITQIDRCKNTMAKLTSLASRKTRPNQAIRIGQFIADLREHFALMDANPMPSFDIGHINAQHYLPGGFLLLHAVINLVDNGIRAAKSRVAIKVSAHNASLNICIKDDGHGLPPSQLETLGDAITESETGLGIGFLLANSTIERLGGSVRFSNLATPDDDPMTCVIINIPISPIDTDE